MDNNISISIAVYSFDRLVFIDKSLNKLNKLNKKLENIIVVVDNNNDLTQYLKEKYHYINKLTIINNNGRGLSHARNTAIKFCSSEYIFFLDDDAIPTSSYLNNITNLDLKYDVFGGPIIPLFPKSKRKKSFPNFLNWIFGCTYPPIYSKTKSHKIRNPIGANMGYRKKILEEIGGFDINFGRDRNKLFTGDETEINHKLRKRGYSVYYDQALKVFHAVPFYRISPRYILKRSYYEGYSKYRMKKRLKSIEDVNLLENNYLSYLLIKLFKSKNIHTKILILFVIFGTGIGYLSSLNNSRK